MSKQVGIAIGIILLLLLGGFGYMKLSGKTAVQTPSQDGTTNTTNNGSAMGSLKDLLTAGKNVSCTVSYTGNQAGTSGTTYVSGKKVRADFTVKTSDGKETVSHMIQDGTYAYIWTANSTVGTKMKVEAVENTDKTAAAPSQPQSQAVDLNQKVNMKCSDWRVDESVFVPPTTVKFTDLSEAMKNLPKTPTSTCDQITDPAAKAQCASTLRGQSGY